MMTKSVADSKEVRPTHSSLIPFQDSLEQLKKKWPHLDGLLAGAVVYRQSDDPTRGLETLVIRRAASDSWPLHWEHSCGSADAQIDEDLVSAATREFTEETGLRVAKVTCAVGLRQMFQANGQEDPELDEGAYTTMNNTFLVFNALGKTWGKLTVMVESDGQNVRLDPQEHDRFLWLTEDEVFYEVCSQGEKESIMFVSEGVRRTILEGFRLKYEIDSTG